MPGAEHVLYQAIVFAEIELTVIAGHDARRILTAVLQHG
jgi:hypothetical protein